MNTNNLADFSSDDIPGIILKHSLLHHDTLRDNYINAATCLHSAHLPTFKATSCEHSPSCFSCPLPDCSWPS